MKFSFWRTRCNPPPLLISMINAGFLWFSHPVYIWVLSWLPRPRGPSPKTVPTEQGYHFTSQVSWNGECHKDQFFFFFFFFCFCLFFGDSHACLYLLYKMTSCLCGKFNKSPPTFSNPKLPCPYLLSVGYLPIFVYSLEKSRWHPNLFFL